MKNISLDLETLGVTPGSVILSIGMVAFDKTGVLPHEFYREITQQSCLEGGLTIDPETEKWWSRQDEEAKGILHRTKITGETGVDGKWSAVSLGVALYQAAMWVNGVSSHPCVWSNGADFDLPILSAAYRAAGFGSPPWQPYNGRCYRTLKNLRPGIKIVRQGTKHNALDDARSQAEHAVRLLNDVGHYAPEESKS